MRRRTDRLALACALICIICVAVLGFVVAPATLDNSVKTDETARLAKTTAGVAAETARLSRENAARTREVARLARAIQDQRKEAIGSACRAQNHRHDNVIRALDVLIARLPPGARRDRAKTNRKGTVFLLNAIVPHQNCAALVAKSAPTPKQPRP
jgi:hypothetical protein